MNDLDKIFNQITEIIKGFNHVDLQCTYKLTVDYNIAVVETIYIEQNINTLELNTKLTILFNNFLKKCQLQNFKFIHPFVTDFPYVKALILNINKIPCRLLCSELDSEYVITLDTAIEKKEMNPKIEIIKEEYSPVGTSMETISTKILEDIKNKDITEFKTGAIRSKDCDNVKYYLISPIGLKAIAKITNKILFNNTHPIICLNKALEFKYQFFSGDKNPDLFAKSALCICNAIKNRGQQKWINNITNVDTPEELRFDMIPYEGIRALAETYHEGALKYSEYNCEKGFPISSLQDHSIQHLVQYMSGDRSEPHLAHALWGDVMSIHSYIMWSELNVLLRDEGCKLSQAIEDHIIESRKKKFENQDMENYNENVEREMNQ